MWKKIGLIILTVVVVFFIATITLTILQKTKQPEVKKVAVAIDENKALNHLSQSITFQTISYDDRTKINFKPYDEFLSFLEKTYPHVYDELDVKHINDYSVVFKWKGQSSDAPIGLMAHYDVVPVAKGTEKNWEQPPFSGVIDDKYVWGRGTLDDKVGVIGILEAVNHLLAEGHKPAQDLYLLFGHDEEIGGDEGAAKIVAYLEKEGIHLRYVLDEGGVIVEDMVPGVSESIGVIGIAEKGSANATLTVEGSGGHSSQPKDVTTLGRLAHAISALEETQFPSDIQGPTKEMFTYVTPEMSFGYRYVFANQWLFKPIIKSILLDKPATAAVTRTTIAPTVLTAGDKTNILPEKATATINMRVIPGDTLDSLKKEIEKIIDDNQVQVHVEGEVASSVSKTDNAAFKEIQQAVLATHDNTVTTPYIMIGGSDAKHYQDVADDTYRFLPIAMEKDGLERMHGTNERIEKQAFIDAISFYVTLIKNNMN